MPFTLASPAHSELLIRKSRFLGCVEPMPDRASASARVATLRQQHPDAAHVCWALLAGGQSAAVDDGEPSGTAGRPMLDVLRHQAMEQVLATVVRYYGGIRLGAGGLVRAYTDSVAQALASAEKIRLQPMTLLHFQAPYALEGSIRRQLAASGATLLQVEHGSLVSFQASIPASDSEALRAQLDELGHGQLGWLGPR
ncbi:IMPACT family protein [Chitinilyticum piscinae]|uniref:YigZ family protein n=1 Tax=Chitinilyticum piscinae TaxID=2866724 RepID=A0A8J7FKN1_9NEIS|nr:YigZ family protein [Chitinilyticum piscinae]MBE9609767.1 YigZ family protein [Chitinilyticum piscinae]